MEVSNTNKMADGYAKNGRAAERVNDGAISKPGSVFFFKQKTAYEV